MKKLLIISGPTATGKTALALYLAKELRGELISADSRQVYREMDIVTGKDLPDKFGIQYSSFMFGEQVPAYSIDDVNIWGYDIVSPTKEWSVAHFVAFANQLIPLIQRQNKLPIIVGGSGLYTRSLLHPPDSLNLPPNLALRQRLAPLTVTQLQDLLRKTDNTHFRRMNFSDQHNPRRLIRAIEIAASGYPPVGERTANQAGAKQLQSATLQLGLTAPWDKLEARIDERINQRLGQGAEREVRMLVKKYGWASALQTTIGYQEWRPYLEGQMSREQVISQWRRHEKQYARRQITWFKKENDIQWFDVALAKFRYTVVSRVKQWYDETHAS